MRDIGHAKGHRVEHTKGLTVELRAELEGGCDHWLIRSSTWLHHGSLMSSPKVGRGHEKIGIALGDLFSLMTISGGGSKSRDDLMVFSLLRSNNGNFAWHSPEVIFLIMFLT